MFTPRDPIETGGGGVLIAPVSIALALPRSSTSASLGRLRPAWTRRDFAALDWAPDLAEDIGSRRWFRGLATLLGLSALALAFLPDLMVVAGAPAALGDRAAQEEFRHRGIAPLALGAGTGDLRGPTSRVRPLAAAPERASVQLTATFGEADRIEAMLERAGVGAVDAGRLAAVVNAVLAGQAIAPGTRFDLLLGARPAPGEPRLLERAAFRARFDLDLVAQRSGGSFTLERRAIAVDTTPVRIRGRVGDGVYLSARAAGLPIGPIQEYLQTLDAHLSVDTDIQPDDTFDIVVAWRRAASGESEPGELLYAGIERDGTPRAQLLRWGREGQFLEASGAGEQRSGLIMPVVGGRMTSGFGQRRHPVLGYTRMHAGIDFAAPTGAPIYAVTSGTVAYAGWAGGHGNHVKLNHGSGFGTGYSHMSSIAVSPGMTVRAGQVIGYVGSTGLSTGPHLHYELYKHGAKVNPLSVRFTVSNQVEGQELAAFRARLAKLQALTPGLPQAGPATVAALSR